MKFALRLKASNNSNIAWIEQENNVFPTKERPVPELLTYSHEDRLINHLIQKNTNRSHLTYLNTIWALLLTEINFNPSMDK